MPRPAVFNCDRIRRHIDSWHDCCLRITRYMYFITVQVVLYSLPGFLPVLMLYYFHKEFSCSYGYKNLCVVTLGWYHDGRIWGTLLLYPDSFSNNRCFTYKLVVTSCTVLEEGRQNVSFWLGTQVNGLAVAPDCIIVFSFFKENIAFVFNWLSPFKRCLKNKCL